jgi:hypothetical protein
VESNEGLGSLRRDRKASLTQALISPDRSVCIDYSKTVARVSTHTIQLALLIPAPASHRLCCPEPSVCGDNSETVAKISTHTTPSALNTSMSALH